MKLGLVQMSVCMDKNESVSKACRLIQEAAKNGADVIALPECFNCPYGTQYFKEYSEQVPGPTTKSLSQVAKECQVYVVGGSIPDNDNGDIYNTCTVFSPSGEMIAKYSKMHLFDVDIPDKIKFQESEIFKPGHNFATFDAGGIRIGIAICYDVRFPEIAVAYADMGCHLILYPAALNSKTGNDWDIMLRARALDNQLYAAVVSPAHYSTPTYCAWGHTTAVSPKGEVLVTIGDEETICYADIDLNVIDDVRRSMPLNSQRRLDVYSRASVVNASPLYSSQTPINK